MNKLRLDQPGGFPFDQNVLSQMQSAYTLLNSLGEIAGNYVIIKGCTLEGNKVTDGIVYLNGEVFEFRGGEATLNVIIVQIPQTGIFETGEIKEIHYTRYVTFGNADTSYPWANFRRLNTLAINNTSNVNYPFTLEDTIKRVVFTSVNPVTATIPADNQVNIPIGSKIEFTQQGTGVVTIADTVTIVTNISKKSVQGETRILTKIGDNTWTLEGNQVVSFEGLQRVYSAVIPFLPTDTEFKKIANITCSPRAIGMSINVRISGGSFTGLLLNLTADIFTGNPRTICVKSFQGYATQGIFRITTTQYSTKNSLEFKPKDQSVYAGSYLVNITTDTESIVEMVPTKLIDVIDVTHEHTTQLCTQVITHT